MTPEERFWSKVDKTETCWLWTGPLRPKGYAMFFFEGKMRWAHRVAYELAIGPIPPGLEVDHVRERGCVNRHCMNPAHLEAVTHAENVRRARLGLRRTHCHRGHLFEEATTRIMPDGARRCRICQRAAFRRRYWEARRG